MLEQLSLFDETEQHVAPHAVPENAAADPMPAYTLRTSARARRLQLKVSPLGKVEVVVPRRAAARDVSIFIERHREWLQNTLAKLGAERARFHDDTARVPSCIELRALGETWTVQRQAQMRSRARSTIAVENDGVLIARGEDDDLLRRALWRWLQAHARERLVPWMHALSRSCRLPYAGLTVRAQRSRWGSCSSQGNISLNRNLLFLPPPLAAYVMLHELCHTRHMNHGSRYWRLVQSHDPDYRTRERELRTGDRYIPAWALPE